MSVNITSDNIQLSEPTSPLPPVASPAIYEPDNCDPEVQRFIAAAISQNTRRAYASDVQHFLGWGGSLPATSHTVARYLAEHAETFSLATLSRRLTAIGRAHSIAGHSNPAANDIVRIILRGIRRTFGRPQQQVAALTKEHLLTILASLGTSVQAVRDRALLMIGFTGAFRRSELAAIDFESIERVGAGLVITVAKSKTDQERRGRQVAIPYSQGAICPINALDDWLDLSRINQGPVFRPITKDGLILPRRLSGEAVAIIVKQRSALIGPVNSRYAGHSLRAGFVTSAAQAGIPNWRIKARTGHKSDAALERYIRNSELFGRNVVDFI